MTEAEQKLIDLIVGLLGPEPKVSAAERKLIKLGGKVSKAELKKVRAAVLKGGDPLGEIFSTARPSEVRREHGATYTPQAIVAAMVDWAAKLQPTPIRVVDPGCGSGRYLMAAAKAFPSAKLVAIDIDPLAALMTRANALILDFGDRLQIKVSDYRDISLPAVKGPTLFLGNPPYVRHHDIDAGWKDWFSSAAREMGFKASKLAGLHIHFFMKTRQIARPGDYGAFITAAEWMDVNYGSVLREMLANGLGGTAVHVIDPKAQPFADALTTAAVTCFCVGQRSDYLTVKSVETLADLAPLGEGRRVSWQEVTGAAKWSVLTSSSASTKHDGLTVGDLFRVHRGQVTGGNDVWVAGEAAKDLPARFLTPAVTRAKELMTSGGELTTSAGLKKVVDLPSSLDGLSTSDARKVEKFLSWARRHGADQSYIARHRKAWWAVGLKDPAPILCTYMARKPPTFVLNTAGVAHLNIAHGLYPREPMSEWMLRAVIQWLTGNSLVSGGRTYAGGLLKFEPREVERIKLPRLDQLHEIAADLEARATRGGRADRTRTLPGASAV